MADRTEFNYLYAPEGHTLMADDKHSYLASESKPEVQGASLAALSAKNAARASGGLAGTSAQDSGGYPSQPVRKAAQRAPTPEELHQMANAMLAQAEANGSTPVSLHERDSSGGVLPSWLTGYMNSQ